MVDLEDIGRIIGGVLALAGIIGLIITVPTLTSSTPNDGGFIASIVSLAVGLLILKFSS